MQIDGFEQEKKVVVVAATNRKQDLDPALIRYVGEHNRLYHRHTTLPNYSFSLFDPVDLMP